MRITEINPRYQPRADMCFPTTIKIVYDELCKSFGENSSLSLNRISKLSKYNRGVRDLDYAVTNLNKYLFAKGYRLFEKAGIGIDDRLIDRILNDGNASAPIVTVGSSWIAENDSDLDIDEVPPDDEHELVVLNKDTSKIYVYDTYAPFSRVQSGLIMPKIEKSIARFLTHWGNANKEILWIEKMKKDVAKNESQKKLLRSV
jgi:hypothetical protein